MKSIVQLAILVLLLGFTACKKKYVEPDIIAPAEFEASFALPNDTVRLQAGKNGNVGRTEAKVVDNGVRLPVYSFIIEDVSGRNRSFRINFNGLPPRSGTGEPGDSNLKESIVPGDYLFDVSAVGEQPQGVSLSWQVNDNEFTTIGTDQSRSSFTILGIQDIYRDGVLYREAEIQFTCELFSLERKEVLPLHNGRAKAVFSAHN